MSGLRLNGRSGGLLDTAAHRCRRILSGRRLAGYGCLCRGWLLCRRWGQGETERGAFAQAAFNPDFAAVGGYDLAADFQAQAGAADLAGFRVIDAVEAGEKLGQRVFRNAQAVIPHPDERAAFRRGAGS